MSLNINNKVALVTGGSSGIGAAIAIKFTQEGAKVAIVGRNRDKLKNVSDTCEKNGRKPLVIVGDVTKDNDNINIITETISFYGKLDILVNNAGFGPTISIMDDKALDVFDKIIATNLRSAVHLTHLAAKHLVETKGNIVNISSVASTIPYRNGSAYAASKAGLDHFTRSVALELAPKGIRVNCVNPGPVKTDILEASGLNEEESNNIWEIFKKGTSLDRIGDAEEIADLVAFVASDKARSITGATLVSDNGMFLKGALKISGV